MCDDLVFSVQELLKLVPGLVLFPFSFYFAYKKIGARVLALLSTTHEMTLAPRISSVALQNLKDRPITIFRIYAVLHDDVRFDVAECDPPVILKALEAVRIDTKPYSQLILNGQKFEPDLVSDLASGNIAIYLVTDKKVIKCKRIAHPDPTAVRGKRYRLATQEVTAFNGVVYNEEAAFAIVYCVHGSADVKTAIVDRSGYICRDWRFPFNSVPREQMKTREELTKYLEAAGLKRFATVFDVHPLGRQRP